ncbi:RepB family plasmid replication initiator protein [Vibrio aestuarianus subsp. cardii]|uniref:RepB family plasmid replication initiator protein n=1 Tax=Vibrio aestuarianus TaxID=28171 RepID=UPI00155934D1|nr:RepB family plasmid replication initiator protein [Vibrio aestuarianus]NGZ66598.1 RepB family plasmid replication initiator protein [Vibrio aestuarianus subsp. cardii]
MAGELITREKNDDYHFKGHNLIYAVLDLTAKQMNITALMLTHMKEECWENGTPEYEFSSDQLSKFFGIPGKQLYSSLKQPCEMLAKRTIGIEDGSSFDYRPLFSRLRYEKGILYMKPNPELKDIYIINSNANGHAKIDNKTFKALPTANQKRVYEFLSRYKYDTHMYYISVQKLQVMFGVISEKGRIIKVKYQSEIAFINKVIAPALKAIFECPIANENLEITKSQTGEIGYELVPLSNEKGYKIRFLVRWKSITSREDLDKAARRAVELTELYKRQKQIDQNPINTLRELEPIFRLLGYDDKAESIKARINKLEIEQAEEESRRQLALKNKEQDKLNAILDTGIFDDI